MSGEEERDRLMLDELGLTNVSECFSHKASSAWLFLSISSWITPNIYWTLGKKQQISICSHFFQKVNKHSETKWLNIQRNWNPGQCSVGGFTHVYLHSLAANQIADFTEQYSALLCESYPFVCTDVFRKRRSAWCSSPPRRRFLACRGCCPASQRCRACSTGFKQSDGTRELPL